MSYSPSDRCPDCGRFHDCRCPDFDACAHCGHDVEQHDNTGCHDEHPTDPDRSCACAANPQPYDPAAP